MIFPTMQWISIFHMLRMARLASGPGFGTSFLEVATTRRLSRLGQDSRWLTIHCARLAVRTRFVASTSITPEFFGCPTC